MKAWELDKELINSAIPRALSEDEQTWSESEILEEQENQKTRLLWHSNVPGSGAPERLMVGATTDLENRGYNVEKAESLLLKGIKAYEENDMIALNQITARVFRALNTAEKNMDSPYWKYTFYDSWERYEKDATFESAHSYDIKGKEYRSAIYAGWVAQICGGAIGTAIEGFTTANLKAVYGSINDYIRKPNTFNDDITFELAFLSALEKKGKAMESADIAEEWIGLIPFGWSAEEIALRNIKYGIYPPESGSFNNPFNEWIGAQMRGAICGMVAPGNPKEAARLAWMDGVVSHINNGVIGEIFNAMLVSLAFVEKDMRKLLKRVIGMLPEKSEYYSVVNFALQGCEKESSWETIWAACEKKFEKYNWIHAYPNAAAEVIALWYGEGNFDKTMHIISMEGQDVDCNAAQIATALGIANGLESIDKRWIEPIGDDLDTYVRGMKKMKISGLADWTVDITRRTHEGE